MSRIARGLFIYKLLALYVETLFLVPAKFVDNPHTGIPIQGNLQPERR